MKNLFAFFLMVVATVVVAQEAVLRPGDQIEIRLGGVPSEDIGQVSAAYTVDGQGYVNMPHIGKVKAAGVTQGELQNAIEAAYRNQQIYTNPTITINVANQARFVNVGGDVRSPQRVPYTADMTLQSAIMACGGFTEYANQKKVQLMQDGKQTIHDFNEIRKNPSKDVQLKPGDHIWVPQSFW
jgi:protein involved in polysaccharide export with SLBB domain